MNDEYLENTPFSELKVGANASVSRTLTQEDILLFAMASGDYNPAHMDPEYAKNSFFKQVIAHGMWGGALISMVIGTKMPGPGSIYLHQYLDFKKPVYLGDTITTSIVVTELYAEKHVAYLDCKCVNQNGEDVIVGKSVIKVPTEKVRWKMVDVPKVFFK